MCWMTVAYVAFIFRSDLAKAVDFRCTPCGEGVLCPVGSSIAGLLNSTGNPNEPRVVNGYSSEQSLPLETCSSICFRSYFYLSFLIICMYNIYIFRYSISSSYFSDPASEVPLFGVCLSWWISRNLRWRPHWPNLRQVPSKWVLLRGAMQCCSFESFETPSVKCTTLDNCHNCFIIICDICDMLDIASCDIWILFKLLCH